MMPFTGTQNVVILLQNVSYRFVPFRNDDALPPTERYLRLVHDGAELRRVAWGKRGEVVAQHPVPIVEED